MAKLIAMYKKPANVAAFDAYYTSTHVPVAKKVAGLRRYEISTGAVMTPQGESPFHLIATLTFDSVDAIQTAIASPAGAAIAADLGNFAQAGVDLLIFDSREI